LSSERRAGAGAEFFPDAAPAWLKPLVDNIGEVPRAYRSHIPADVAAAFKVANAAATVSGTKRDAAVLVLF
jgi:hypothetical protein